MEVAAKERRGMSSDPVFEQLGFKHNLKYGPRSKLRKACTRFLRFSYLLDFVALETLTNIFIESVKDTVVRLRDLAAVKPDFELKKVVKNVLGEIVQASAPAAATNNNASSKRLNMDYLLVPVPHPIFKVETSFLQAATNSTINPGSEGVPLRLYKQMQVKPFEPPPIGKNKDFDPLVHIELVHDSP